MGESYYYIYKCLNCETGNVVRRNKNLHKVKCINCGKCLSDSQKIAQTFDNNIKEKKRLKNRDL